MSAEPGWRIGIAGAGAIGTTLAVRLGRAGHDVAVLARGRTLATILADGLILTDLEGSHQVMVNAGAAQQLGAQDILFLCAKAQDLAGLVQAAAPMIGPQTLVVPVINGIPWWYFHGVGGRHQGRAVAAVDPGGRLLAALPMDRVIGAVTFITAERPAPGRAVTANPMRMILGEIDHTVTARAGMVGEILGAAGITAEISPRLRDPLWTKVIANLTSNPLSVISGATLQDIYGHADLAPVARQMLEEGLLTAAAHGARVELDPDSFLAMGAGMGAVKTSMLQDFEKGLALELSSIGDAVIELAALQGLSMPLTRNILSLVRYRGAPVLSSVK